MGDNLYTAYWQSVLPQIIEQFKVGKEIVQLPVTDLSKYGDRQSYYSNFRINYGKIEIPKNAYAQGRDLFAVLTEDEYFKENLIDKLLLVTISKELQLKIEILPEDAPDFFNEEDFIQLKRFVEQRMNKNNPEHQKTYDYLKETYSKTDYWARQVQKKLFPNGFVHIVQKPTNQASVFEYYHWAKIYPDKISFDYKALAFTVGIDTDDGFTIKIDTVGLYENDARRQTYLQKRGDHRNSQLVKHISQEQILNKGWHYLIDLTANIILDLKSEFNLLFTQLSGIQNKPVSQKPETTLAMALNTILYGPPGTGKTYKLQSLCNEFIVTRSAQTRVEFLEEKIGKLTWWETIAAAMAVLKRSTVPEIEKHEFIKIKSRQSTTVNVKQVIWGQLQYHTDPSCEHVKFTKRTEPYLFIKDENSVWSIIEERLNNEAPEILDFLNAVNNYRATTKSVSKNYQMVTFHQSFSYEDFVEGIKPVISDEATDELQYEVKKGIFYQACKEAVQLAGYNSLIECIEDSAEARKSKFENAPIYAIFIDEINRANVSSVFGELITLIEDDKRLGKEHEIVDVTLPYSKTKFGVPGNLYLIGTMNTADRSVEALDTALRRRFSFEEIKPDESLLSPQNLIIRMYNSKYAETDWDDKEYRKEASALYELVGVDTDFEKRIRQDARPDYADDDKIRKLRDEDFKGVNLKHLLSVINQRIMALLTKDHAIGHAWLLNVYSIGDLKAAFKNKILPLLQEYFYNDYAKIGLVLGKRFVETKTENHQFAHFDPDLANEYSEKTIYFLRDVFNMTLEDFKSVYE